MLNSQCKFHVKTSDRSSHSLATNSYFSSIIYLLLLFLSFLFSFSLFPSHRRACELPSRVSGVFIFRFVSFSFNKNRIHFERRWEWISRWISRVYTRKLVMQCRILMPLFILDPAWTDTNISMHDSFSLSSLSLFFFYIYQLLTINNTSRSLLSHRRRIDSSIHPYPNRNIPLARTQVTSNTVGSRAQPTLDEYHLPIDRSGYRRTTGG